MKVAYYNNCWFTNVGEAFIDIGAMNIVGQIWEKPTIACISDMSDWYAESLRQRQKSLFCKSAVKYNSGKIYKFFEVDYLVMAGMFASEVYLNSPGRKMVDEMVQNGAKLILLGLGSEKYSEEERNKLSCYYEKIKPELIVTRDEKTYEAYKNCAETISGLDCAFWVKDSFDPRGVVKKNYNVHSFNRSQEPENIGDDGIEIIRAFHRQWYTQFKGLKENFFISDTPYDYLTLYANANRVYTDLVHATIPALQYGIPVKYYYFDQRSNAFDSLNCLKTDENGFMTIDEKKLENQKNDLIQSIKKTVINDAK